MNTREFIKNVQLWAGGMAMLTTAGIAYAIYRGVNSRKYHRKYDPDKVEEIKGKIIDITPDQSNKDEQAGLVIILETEKEEIIPVHLGPSWYLSHQKKNLKKGESIKVIGARMSDKDNSAMVAAKVHSGKEMLVLREDDGTPRWSSWMKEE